MDIWRLNTFLNQHPQSVVFAEKNTPGEPLTFTMTGARLQDSKHLFVLEVKDEAGRKMFLGHQRDCREWRYLHEGPDGRFCYSERVPQLILIRGLDMTEMEQEMSSLILDDY